ncbi:hypothetical protein LOTGIDRAFT_238238 [Lottia gigantea]|uniref:F-box domain-containing protein n=1 Tax=Lottia gigantea TaxID=225164 RepID=V4B695_LOTGI|nr:hypothetical protein LOTGIDRAFT_238238 [Lottia gigantea]ESP01622.1 hypothetical protein LOTGIDRAFT_238238 [Lottia gigantea]
MKDKKITDLPADVLLKIFCYLDFKSLQNVACVNSNWSFVCSLETLWKRLCMTANDDALKYIYKSRINGLSWKESYVFNYRPNLIRRKWNEGFVSNIEQFEDLPAITMCKMDAEEWGAIFEQEERR